VADPIRYYLDQNVYGAVASGLRQHGIDVLTAQEAGRCGLPDAEQLAFATAEERVMVTFDPDSQAPPSCPILPDHSATVAEWSPSAAHCQN